VSWSTPAVLDETLARAGRGGLEVHQLARLRDIDTVADLRAEWPRVRSLLETRPDLRRRIETRLRKTPEPGKSAPTS
jgi:hypothetical protein